MCGVLDLAKMDCENGECLWDLQGMLIDEVCLLSGLVSGFWRVTWRINLKGLFRGILLDGVFCSRALQKKNARITTDNTT